MKTLYETFKDIFTAEDPCTVLKTLECLLKAVKQYSETSQPTQVRRFVFNGYSDKLSKVVMCSVEFPKILEEESYTNAYDLLRQYLAKSKAFGGSTFYPCTGVAYVTTPSGTEVTNIFGMFHQAGSLIEEGVALMMQDDSNILGIMVGDVTLQSTLVTY